MFGQIDTLFPFAKRVCPVNWNDWQSDRDGSRGCPEFFKALPNGGRIRTTEEPLEDGPPVVT
jgi:hypothetical protein